MFDERTFVGGAVRNYAPGKQYFIVAIDYSSMYPTNKTANNIDTSSRVDDYVIEHPDEFGLKIVKRMDIDDMFGKREIIYVKKT